jgi:hypothetical protein
MISINNGIPVSSSITTFLSISTSFFQNQINSSALWLQQLATHVLAIKWNTTFTNHTEEGKLLRSVLFWGITQHQMVIFTEVSARISPIFKDQEVKGVTFSHIYSGPSRRPAI